MELKAVEGMRVCAECGHALATWVIQFYWAGVSINLCEEHYDAMQCLMPKPKKPEKQTKKPKREIY